jgi:hypothetical protein
LGGPVKVVNLLRFREWADYSKLPDAVPDEPISGRQAYDKYMDHTTPFLIATGRNRGVPQRRWSQPGWTERGTMGPGHGRPPVERAELPRVRIDQDYLAGTCHRTAALADSRLCPFVERALV